METLSSGLTPYSTASCEDLRTCVSKNLQQHEAAQTPQLLQSPKISHLVNYPLLSKPYLLLYFFLVLLNSGSVDFTPKLPHHLFHGWRGWSKGKLKVGRGKVGVSWQGHLTCPLDGQLRPPPSICSFTSRKSTSKYINISSLTSPNPKISEHCLPFSPYFTSLLLNAVVTWEAKMIQRQFLQLPLKKQRLSKSRIGWSSRQTQEESVVSFLTKIRNWGVRGESPGVPSQAFSALLETTLPSNANVNGLL